MDDVALVEATAKRWSELHPDLDVDVMATFLLMARMTARATRRIEDGFASHDLTTGEFDVLASLVQADGPLKPSQLAALAMVSPAGMTNRIDRLEEAGLVERRHDLVDRRSSLIELTEEGRDLVSNAVQDHVRIEQTILDPLSPAERRQLVQLHVKLLRHLTDGAAD